MTIITPTISHGFYEFCFLQLVIFGQNKTRNYVRRILSQWFFGPGGSIRQLHQLILWNAKKSSQVLDFFDGFKLVCMAPWRDRKPRRNATRCFRSQAFLIFLVPILKKKTGNCEESRSFKRMWSFLAIIFVFGFCIIILFKSYLYNTAEKCLCQ